MFSLKTLALAASVSLFAKADVLDLSYSVIGDGGFSQPVAGLSDVPFWWADNTGNVSAAYVQSTYGYSVVDAHPSRNPDLGSLLVSSPFEVGAGQTLSFDVTWVSNEYQPPFDTAFALLLQGSSVVAVLYEAETGSNPMLGDSVSLGGIQYGPCNGFGCTFPTGSTAPVTSSYSPGAGTFQLVFGVFDTIDPHPVTDNPPRPVDFSATAIALGSVRVPEPGFLPSILVDITGLACLLLAATLRKGGWQLDRPR
jgi:hypothetical protein